MRLCSTLVSKKETQTTSQISNKGYMMKKNKLDDKLLELASMYPFGSLTLSVNPTEFLQMVIDEITELRGQCKEAD